MTIPILDSIVAVSRINPDSDNTSKESYVIDLSLQAVKMNIQPASPEDTVLIEGVFAKTWRAFTTYSGVLTGDLITISGTGNKMVVKGVQDWSSEPIPHYELLLVEPTNF